MGGYHDAHLGVEVSTSVALMYTGVGEVSAAIRAGTTGLRLLEATNGMRLATAAASVDAAYGASVAALGGTSFASSIVDEKGSNCHCSTADPPATKGAEPGLRPESKYTGSKKHGVEWNEGIATAKKTGKPQGQWGSTADLEYAGKKAATLKPGEGGWFQFEKGHSSVVHRADGTTVNASKFWVRNNGSGTFHGYPAE
jgi:hypothetical protein